MTKGLNPSVKHTVTIRISGQVWYKAKLAALQSGKTLELWLTEAITEKTGRETPTSKETV